MGGGDVPANTTSTQTQNPWYEAIPYILGTGGHVGIYPQMEALYNQYNQLTPDQTAANSFYQGALKDRYDFTQHGYGMAQDLATGKYDPTGQAQAYTSDFGNAMASMGAMNPTGATQQLLSGAPNNPYLASMNQANIDQALRGYGDAVQQFAQQTLPQTENDAFAAGQYGSSRQGVEQGLAEQQMLRNARDLGIAAMDSGNTLYGGAYENAQNRMATTANNLAQLGVQNSQFNAGQLQNNSQFNQTLNVQQKAAAAQNQMSAIQATKDVAGMQDQMYNQYQSLLQAPQNQSINMLNQLASVVWPAAGKGGQVSTQIPTYNNTTGQVLGALGTIGGAAANYYN